tara:strand:+ start:623 stop:796 length:174 start_codon:yes stop_codon:yes gene_type:complete
VKTLVGKESQTMILGVAYIISSTLRHPSIMLMGVGSSIVILGFINVVNGREQVSISA